MVDLSARADRLDAYLSETGLEAVWFARPNSFAWLVGGSNVGVVGEKDGFGVAAAGYDGTFRVIVPTNEADRFRDEELPDRVSIETFPWYESSLAVAIAERSPSPATADIPIDRSGFETLDASRLRQPLSEADREDYRELGREAAAAVETVCRQLESTDPEYEVAAAIEIALASRDVSTPVVLVGGGDRARRYPNPTPSDAELGEYAIVSVTVERAGLYASLTRTVAFDAPDWLEERHRAAARIEATALAATRAAIRGELNDGETIATSGDVFAVIREAYDAVGFPEEWRTHHQGGAAGFDTREWIATPEGDDPVTAPMGYAWNPTVVGAKSEDTYLLSSDRSEILTKTGQWPTVEVDPIDVEALDGGSTPSLERHTPIVL
ncbi:M24 family metallopeptidase [Halopenitus sp. H-Gu1]|uniref:M24 family metallopeptidase n=1 Tax=Halopenitus sp. H-Gu1 TaxID=3242697 RepID=UPI00359D3271